MAARYLPSQSDYDRLVAWCRGVGFEPVLLDRNHTTVYLRAPVGLAQSALGAQFARVGNGSEEFSSAVTPPSLPDAIAENILSVSGLQPERRVVRLRAQRVLPQLLKSNGSEYVTPSDIAAAYDFPAGLNGAGQTIALVEDAPGASSQYSSFWNIVGSPTDVTRVTEIHPDRNPLQNSSADEPETALDVEWAGSLAPAAKLRVYVDADIFVAIGAVLNDVPQVPGMNVLSISYGGYESQVYDASYSQTLLQLHAAGVTVIASSGELNDVPGQAVPSGVQYPASDPNVTSVAGTKLQLGSNGNYLADTYLDYTGSFSGYDGTSYVEGAYTVRSVVGTSSIFAIPNWQKPALAAARVNDLQLWQTSGTNRQVPDVAGFALGEMDGSPLYALDYDNNGPDPVFGTSISAPIWSAIIALVNDRRAQIGKPPIIALNPALYQAFNLNALNLPAPLSMPNNFSPSPVSGVPPSPPTYAYMTGLGRPDVAELILCLGDEFYSYCDQWASALIPGGTVSLTAHTVGADAQFQWQVDTGSGWTNLSDGENPALSSAYAGSQTASLTVVARSGYPGTYRYRALATAASGVVARTGPVPVVVGQRPTATVTVKMSTEPLQPLGSLNLSVASTGSAFQWELNGQPIPGANQNVFAQRITTGSQGYYSVVVSDRSEPTLSTTVNLGYVVVALPDRIYHVSAIAGGAAGFQNGTGSSANFNNPAGVAFDNHGNIVVADVSNNCIRRITPAGLTTTLAGSATAGNSDGIGAAALFRSPTAVAVDANGAIFVADSGNYRIRKIAPNGAVTTVAGSTSGYADGLGNAAMFYLPTSIAVDSSGEVYVSDSDIAHVPAVTRIRIVNPDGTVATLASVPGSNRSIAVDGAGNLYTASSDTIFRIGPNGGLSTIVSSQGSTIDLTNVQTFEDLNQVAADASGHLLFSDLMGVRQLSPTGAPENVITDSGQAVYFGEGGGSPTGLATDAAGDFCYSWRSSFYAGSNKIYLAKLVALVTKSVPIAAVPAGNSVNLAVSVSSDAGPSSFQWQHDGMDIPGATSATLTVNQVEAADCGDYSVVWTSPAGSSTLGAGTLRVTRSDATIVNLSARAAVGSQSDVLITGFVVGGGVAAAPKRLLITGRGPFLHQFGILDFLPTPEATLFDGQSRPIATELGWSNPPVLASAAGASPLAAAVSVTQASPSLVQQVTGGVMSQGSSDAALLTTLPPGAYTNIISGANGDSGVALAEVFNTDSSLGTGSNESRLVNVSARARVGSGNQVLIAGLVVDGGTGGAAETVMIRGQGPNLANFGLLDVMDHTRITIYDSHSAPIASNAGWSNLPVYASGAGASPLANSGARLLRATAGIQQQYAGNAFDLGSSDSAMVASLPAGQYTIVLDNPDGLTGVGLIEVYELQ